MLTNNYKETVSNWIKQYVLKKKDKNIIVSCKTIKYLYLHLLKIISNHTNNYNEMYVTLN